MCLGMIGIVTEVWDAGGIPMARADCSGESKAVCLLYVPDAGVGDDVLVHSGYAIEILGSDEAAEARHLRGILAG